jgi:glyoxylase-like metal-dependent hydrolase (beta-lactamase superfamily II)
VVEGRESLPPPALREWELPIWELVDGTVPTAPPVAVDTSLAPGDALPWERPAHALAAPGHTPGSVAFWFETERVLFAGDAIALFAGRPVAGVFNVDSALAQRSFAALAELDSDIACFGHGDPIRERAATILRDAR